MTAWASVNQADTLRDVDGRAAATYGRCFDHRPLMIEVSTRHSPEPRSPPAFKERTAKGCDIDSLSRGVPKSLPQISTTICVKRVSQLHASDSGSPEEVYLHSRSHAGRRVVRSPIVHDQRWSTTRPLSVSIPQLQVPSEYGDRLSRSYRLEIVQHPLRAAEFGSSTLTRLPLAPPLIAQLHLHNSSTPEDIDESDIPFLIAHLTLYSADGSRPLDIVGPSGHTPSQQSLYGNLVSSPHILRNLQGRQGVYFLFPDVSIRWRGRFQLSVTLMRIDPYSGPDVANRGAVLAQARSLPFDVCARSDYIAPAQTPLTQYFLQQGARMITSCLLRS